jgi:hypothetical protein
MPDQPIHRPPPSRTKAPAEDTARYVAWMARRGTPVGAHPDDKAREAVLLRVADWGFFDHGVRDGDVHDRAALDRADHAVLPSDKDDKGDWYALLSTRGLDALAALERAAWLFRAGPVDPSPRTPKVTPPTLTTAGDGTITLQGWILYPPAGRPTRLTVTAGPKGAKLVNE